MPTFMKAYSSPNNHKTIKLLNKCRQFLGVTTLADITLVKGDCLDPYIYNGLPPSQRLRPYLWPRQPRTFSPDHWKAWKMALDKCFVRTGSKELRIQTQLGAWMADGTNTWQCTSVKLPPSYTNRMARSTFVGQPTDLSAGPLPESSPPVVLVQS
jgi:hypothetical protein